MFTITEYRVSFILSRHHRLSFRLAFPTTHKKLQKEIFQKSMINMFPRSPFPNLGQTFYLLIPRKKKGFQSRSLQDRNTETVRFEPTSPKFSYIGGRSDRGPGADAGSIKTLFMTNSSLGISMTLGLKYCSA